MFESNCARISLKSIPYKSDGFGRDSYIYKCKDGIN